MRIGTHPAQPGSSTPPLASAELEAQKAATDVDTARSRRLPQFTVEAQALQLLRPIDIHFPEGAFGDLAVAMAMSIGMIFLALVIQFRHAVKPLIVFAAIPFGIVGALATLWLMGSPFGFMAFLGVASLIGVIVIA